jgi:acyl carrier protein
MEQHEILGELKTILMTRLKFDAARASEITIDKPLAKGVEGSLGLDSLDFIELSIAIEERFGIVIEEIEDLAPHFHSFKTLSRFIAAKMDGGA